jgi:hypothetical protein
MTHLAPCPHFYILVWAGAHSAMFGHFKRIFTAKNNNLKEGEKKC